MILRVNPVEMDSAGLQLRFAHLINRQFILIQLFFRIWQM